MKKKVLIVDDEESTVQLIEFILEKGNLIPILAHSGVKALEKAREERPDLILLDIMMPGMDGLEVCEEIKKDPQLKEVPILFLTALGQETDVERGLKLGAHGYIIKPFNPSDLLHQINLILSQK